MLEELLSHGFGKDSNLNCAEIILYGANEAYNIGLQKQSLRLAAGFGEGMGVQTTCGAAAGAIMVLSILFVKNKAKESALIKELCREFFSSFQEKAGEIDCRLLKENQNTNGPDCDSIVLIAASVLDTIYKKHKNKVVPIIY
ncbi:MAG: C-GCAxxG-C-C family (seleno)protein [Spirochaetia bacterium]